MTTVTLGDIEFDPTTGTDFRLSIEGTSGVGKSNTLRVILEDLAEVNIPTLIVERLGAITPVRTEDENIVVVGGRDEEGIDLVIPLESLELVGELVLDRGMKVLVDISTYADYEEEKSRVHLAAGKAVRALNDRAHEKYRSGDRTPSLLVIDEAHWLAPKDSAPNPDLDEWVKRARGQIIKAATEGGNKGISTIVAYQRRAFLHNGVIQLCQDWVAHRPGDEDIDRTADALRCDSDVLAGLGVGEILARGPAITGGDLVGPTKVRRCDSPDPREETFELPETPPEVSDALESIQEEVEAEQERRREQEDELERVRERLESLEEERDELQEEVRDNERLARAFENARSGNGGTSEEVAAEIEELEERKNELAQQVDKLKDENADLQEQLDEKDERIEELQQEYEDDLTALNSLRTAFQLMGLDGDGGAVEPVSDEEIERVVEQKIQDLDVGGGRASVEPVESVQDALLSEFQEEAVNRVINRVNDLSEKQQKLLRFLEGKGRNVSSKSEWVQQALGWSSYDQATSEAMKGLEEDGFVRKNKNGSIAPNVRGLVEEELDGYDVSDETVEETHQKVLAKLTS